MSSRFFNFIHEMSEIGETIGFYSGRFQPLHKSHAQIIDYMAQRHLHAYVILVKGGKSSKNKDENPFDEHLQVEMLKKVIPNNVKVIVSPTAYLPDIVSNNNIEGDRFTLYCGPDRVNSYKHFQSKFELINKRLNIIPLNFERGEVSGTRLREALRAGDKETFMKMTPQPLHSMYEKLREHIMRS